MEYGFHGGDGGTKPDSYRSIRLHPSASVNSVFYLNPRRIYGAAHQAHSCPAEGTTVEYALSHHLSQLLIAWGDGDAAALEQLAPLVDDELRRLARHYLRKRPSNYLLQTTALINEAWLKLIESHAIGILPRAGSTASYVMENDV